MSQSQREGPARLPYFPALDGIRALSVAAVLFFHGGFPWASGGYLGVSAFFTLSGFLITSLLIGEREATGRIRIFAFWDRRFRRLLPAALATLAGVALYGATVADTDQLWRLRGDTLSALTYVANWRFLVTGQAYEALFSAPSPVQHFWSLAIEEQYYLFFPLLVVGLYALGKGRRPLVVAFALSAAASTLWMSFCVGTEGPISRAYYGTDTRAGELLVGALLAAVWNGRNGPRSAGGRSALQGIGALALVALVALWCLATTESRWLFHGGLLAHALASAIVIAAALQPGVLSTCLATAPLRGLGRISYGVYLYHWPLFLALDADATGLDGPVLFGLRVAATLVVALASFYTIEQPIRSGRLRVDRRVWLAMPAAIAGVALLQMAVTRDLETPWYAPDAPESAATVSGAAAEPSGGRGEESSEGAERSHGSGVRAWIVGDSVALALSSGLAKWGQKTGKMRLRNLARIGCSFVRPGEVKTQWGAKTRAARCSRWPTEWPPKLEEFDPEIVFVMTGLWDLLDRKLPEWEDFRAPGDPAFDDLVLSEYQEVVDLLSARGALVLWINQACVDPDHPGIRRQGLLFGTEALSRERIVAFNETLLARLAASRPGRMRLIDLHRRICPGGRYPVEGSPLAKLRGDGVHFTKQGAFQVSRWLGPLALKQLKGARVSAGE